MQRGYVQFEQSILQLWQKSYWSPLAWMLYWNDFLPSEKDETFLIKFWWTFELISTRQVDKITSLASNKITTTDLNRFAGIFQISNCHRGRGSSSHHDGRVDLGSNRYRSFVGPNRINEVLKPLYIWPLNPQLVHQASYLSVFKWLQMTTY